MSLPAEFGHQVNDSDPDSVASLLSRDAARYRYLCAHHSITLTRLLTGLSVRTLTLADRKIALDETIDRRIALRVPETHQ